MNKILCYVIEFGSAVVFALCILFSIWIPDDRIKVALIFVELFSFLLMLSARAYNKRLEAQQWTDKEKEALK